MKFSLSGAVRLFDDLGHPIRLTYKGSETYQSFLGGVLSIGVLAFTIAMVITKVTAVVSMSDPIITSYPRQLTNSERKDIGDVRFLNSHFNIGVSLDIVGPGLNLHSFPPEIARLVAYSTRWVKVDKV